MGEDEISTMQTLKKYREVMARLVQDYQGRVIDSPGDNILAEFGSVVDAVECAVKIQKELKEENSQLPENRRMEFRMGVNLGDVIDDEGRIYGDGVNVASRVEGLAEGGGICISGTAFDQIGKKLPLGYEFLGEQEVKNIESPVRVYKILTEPEAVGKLIGEEKPRPKGWRWAVAASAIVILVAGAFAVWNFYMRPDVEPASVEKMAFPLPEKPSIAVLPFDNLSGDPKQEYFSDGLTEEIITGLSKVPQLFVIARNSTFTYKGKAVKIQQVAEELGVQYVLEGSVRKAGDRVRITAQLIDALTGHHLWAERYDRGLKDIFALQDEITIKIITALRVKLTTGDEARLTAKGTENLQAYLKFLKARESFFTQTKEGNIQARRLVKEVIEQDSEFPTAYALLGATHWMDVIYGSSEFPRESLKRAFELTQKAIALDDSHATAHSLLGWLYLFMKRQYDKAIAECERAVSLAPSSAMTNIWMAGVLTYAGRHEEAVRYSEQALRLNPLPEGWYFRFLGYTYFGVGQYEDAIAAYKKALNRAPNDIIAHLALTTAYSWANRLEEARAQAAEVLRINPEFSVKQRARTLPYKNQADLERYLDGLRKAGLPETPSLPLPDKPSIAVLPFVNMSGDPEQEYFSDGITEDIITNLSKVSRLFVISRNSSFLYKGKQVKIQDVARDLGVRYVLEGSVRKGGDRVRITAQLIDGKTEHHVWADSYDRKLKDIFSVQDDVTQKVVSELAIALTVNEVERLARKHTENFEAYEMFLRARREMTKLKKENHLKAQESFKRVIELDPNFAGGYACLSFLLSRSVRFGYSTSPREDVEKALEMAQKAISIDNTYWFSYQALAGAHLMKRRHDDALAAITEAVRIQPGLAQVHLFRGFYLHWMGRGEEAVQAIEKALQLNPKYLSAGGPVYFGLPGYAYFTAGRYEESIAAWKKAIDRFGPLTLRLAFLTASYSELGRNEEARAMAQQLLETNPKFTLNSWKVARVYKYPKDTKRLLNALRRAGLK
jgi:adenylate cyclase